MNAAKPLRRDPHLGLIGVFSILVSAILYVTAVVTAPVLRVLSIERDINQQIIWVSGFPFLVGLIFMVFDALSLAPRRRLNRTIMNEVVNIDKVTVVLTAYNDESSIGLAVEDFLDHPKVARVIVVDNNSKDGTSKVAKEAGAICVLETKPGYGQCVYRALTEGSNYTDTELVLLCEGDMTFRSDDIDKFLAYARHADVVNGTRIIEQLRQPVTQLTSMMFYGNFVVGKLLELKHLGKGTISDVGTTYKLCRSKFLRKNLEMFDPNVNLEFNAHFLEKILDSEFRLVEVPVTFHPRVGESKGGNVSNRRALRVGFRMIAGILFGWKLIASKEK
jgi:glycosyltransferase involved in cell wall biosynthesis